MVRLFIVIAIVIVILIIFRNRRNKISNYIKEKICHNSFIFHDTSNVLFSLFKVLLKFFNKYCFKKQILHNLYVIKFEGIGPRSSIG